MYDIINQAHILCIHNFYALGYLIEFIKQRQVNNDTIL